MSEQPQAAVTGAPPPDRTAKAQRVRIRFARGPEAGAVGHVDLARLWERALEEAGVAVSRSQGRRGQARLTLAAGLPLGVTSEGELLDVVLWERLRTDELVARVRPNLPPGIELRDAWEAGMGLPSLPTAVRWADYEVDVAAAEGLDEAIASFLARETLAWRDTRGEKVREYDLRPLVQELRVDKRCGELTRLSMRLRCDAAGVGRADQVVLALGLPQAVRVHRRRLVLAEVSPARDAWRRRGRFAG